jgi:hypothetical protein
MLGTRRILGVFGYRGICIYIMKYLRRCDPGLDTEFIHHVHLIHTGQCNTFPMPVFDCDQSHEITVKQKWEVFTCGIKLMLKKFWILEHLDFRVLHWGSYPEEGWNVLCRPW